MKSCRDNHTTPRVIKMHRCCHDLIKLSWNLKTIKSKTKQVKLSVQPEMISETGQAHSLQHAHNRYQMTITVVMGEVRTASGDQDNHTNLQILSRSVCVFVYFSYRQLNSESLNSIIRSAQDRFLTYESRKLNYYGDEANFLLDDGLSSKLKFTEIQKL